MTAFGTLADLLHQLAVVASQLAPDEYADSDVPGVSGSIGGHVRHCLDHVRALEQGLERGLIDYDTRRRESTVARDREAAVLSLLSASARLRAVPDDVLTRTVVVRAMLAENGHSVEALSSAARELAFVVNHTIHHHAQIALLAHRMGSTRLPARFGLAPGTPALAGAA